MDTNNTIASNFYPMTSAIAVRDVNSVRRKQVTIMADRSHAASAGLRD